MHIADSTVFVEFTNVAATTQVHRTYFIGEVGKYILMTSEAIGTTTCAPFNVKMRCVRPLLTDNMLCRRAQRFSSFTCRVAYVPPLR